MRFSLRGSLSTLNVVCGNACELPSKFGSLKLPLSALTLNIVFGCGMAKWDKPELATTSDQVFAI